MELAGHGAPAAPSSALDERGVGCREGFQATGPPPSPGVCTVSDDGTAEYVGQTVSCEPLSLKDGSLAPEYCMIEAPEVIERCCEEAHCPKGGHHLPPTCSTDCAERWLPLWQDCEEHLEEFGGLTPLCEDTAENLLSVAPRSIELSGLQCHEFANGVYSHDYLTVSGRPAFTLRNGRYVTHLYFRDSPDRWCLSDGISSTSCT